MKELSAGENCAIPSAEITVSVTCASSLDVSAVLLGADRRVRSDADLVFYNNPAGPGVTFLGQVPGGITAVRIDTAGVPADVETIVLAASLGGVGPGTFAQAGRTVVTVHDVTRVDAVRFGVPGMSTETALVCLEVYRRAGAWKLRAVGQGYDTGLAGIATDFGIDITDDAPVSEPPVPTPVAAVGAPSPVPIPAPGGHPMHSDLFAPAHAEVTGSGIQKQGGKMCKIALDGEVMARSGSMVAYQGSLQFAALGSGGIGNAIKQRLTGEGVPLMKVTGRGDLFLANAAGDVHLIDLDGTDGLTVNGANVLAFEPTLKYKVERVHGAAMASGAGLFNCVFTGHGRIALTTDGAPVVLTVDEPTYADPQAAVAWSASLRTGVQRNDQFNLGTLMGRSTGERFTLSFSGQGFVVVQPSEEPPGGAIGGTGKGEQAGVGGTLGGLLGR